MKARSIFFMSAAILAVGALMSTMLFGQRERRDVFDDEDVLELIGEDAAPFEDAVTERIPYAPYPFRDNPPIRFTGMFGEPRRDHFHNGLDIAGNRFEVSPLYAGDLLFYFDEADDPTRTVYGPGNVVVLEHPGNIRTYYYHLYAGSVQKEYARLMQGDYLAESGNSGRSSGAHLHLSIEDLEQNSMVDPMTALPAPESDTIAPKVYGIYILTDRGLRQMNNGMTIRGAGPYKLYAKAYDLAGGITLGLKRVTFSIDGEVVRTYDFSKFTKKNFEYHLAPDYAYDDVYGVDPYFFRGGDFSPERRRYDFVAEIEDYGGNVASMKRTIQFN